MFPILINPVNPVQRKKDTVYDAPRETTRRAAR